MLLFGVGTGGGVRDGAVQEPTELRMPRRAGEAASSRASGEHWRIPATVFVVIFFFFGSPFFGFCFLVAEKQWKIEYNSRERCTWVSAADESLPLSAEIYCHA